MINLKLYQKPGDFLAKFNPLESYQLFRHCITPAQCIRSGAPALSSVRKLHNKPFVVEYITLWIVGLNEFLNIKTKMNPSQIQQTAEIIFNSYYYLNIADLNLIFTNIKTGIYGSLYESLDGAKILTWFNQYIQDRLETSLNSGGARKIIDLGKITDGPDFKQIGHGQTQKQDTE